MSRFSTRFVFAAAALLTATSVQAADFSEGSTAKEWGLYGEEKAMFSGKVVDIMCELSGNCADNCGDGRRNLGVVRDADNALVMVLKNAQSAFNGATADLLPFCNKAVDVDGVMIGDDEDSPSRFYMVQKIRAKGDAEWTKANKWTKDWAKKNPDAKGKGPWFRRDPRVLKQLAAEGHFGLGVEFDQQYLKDNE
ncbi:hypothetical protein [Ahrensia sp. R2A130]|uniref:hypothetical protein n=1 Tax=Ahrensia sp. R2A130 TaxID=744979 RepID=UPI0001E08C13|nr:hypothetical protein [Ahrensia sp. R2A130]EFL90546.1 conserved hypothetical protein [Ahrensia sp. R2A130]